MGTELGVSELRLSLSRACVRCCGGRGCGSRVNGVMLPGGLWLPLLCHSGCQGSGKKLAVTGLSNLPHKPKGWSHSHHASSTRWSLFPGSGQSGLRICPKLLAFQLRKQAGHLHLAVSQVCTLDYHPSLRSGQETLYWDEIVTKFSRRFPSACGL